MDDKKFNSFMKITSKVVAVGMAINMAALATLGILELTKKNTQNDAKINDVAPIVEVEQENVKNSALENTITSTQNFVLASNSNKVKVAEDGTRYRPLEELRKVKLPTKTQYFNGKPYQVVAEQDVLELSREFKYAIKDYFKACGAGDWTSTSTQDFWPEDIEYIVTAIAFVESSYRADVINNIGCGGLTGIQKEDTLQTLNGWANNSGIWGSTIPYINCNPAEVDMFNPATCIEYTYYSIGYNLANRLKKDKSFIDNNGRKQSVWKHVDYTPENQRDMIIASHFWGLTNVVNGATNTTGKGRDANFYMNSDYVNKVLDKYQDILVQQRGVSYLNN